MQQFNALRRFWPQQLQGGQVPVGMQEPFNPVNQFNPMPFEGGMPGYQKPFQPMPFEGGMQDPGKGGFYGQFSGPFNVPNMGTPNRNALMGLGGGFRRPGMMGIRQRY